MMSNRPGQPRRFSFITEKENVTVYSSRAHDGWFLFGAFKNFTEALHEGKLTGHGNAPSREIFGMLIQDLNEKKQIVGPDAFLQAFDELAPTPTVNDHDYRGGKAVAAIYGSNRGRDKNRGRGQSSGQARGGSAAPAVRGHGQQP
jgi:hypothetical protein